MPTVVICDFDGTIMDVDTGKLILEKFAEGNWRHYDRLYDEMKMPVAEVLRHQFAMVKSSRGAILAAVEHSADFREGFEELLRACKRRGVPFVVASYGVDFCIRHFLGRSPLGREVRVYAPSTRVTRRGTFLRFPKPMVRGSENIKDGLVRYHRERGATVVYVGDGTSDFAAIREANVRYAIRKSRLAMLCKGHGISVAEISNFGPVTEYVTGSML